MCIFEAADGSSPNCRVLPAICYASVHLPHEPPHNSVARRAGLRLCSVAMAQGTKPPRSPIYRDPNRPAIERALALGISISQVARRFGYWSDAITRFRDRMPPQVKAAIAAAALKPKEQDLDQLRIDESEGILGNLALQRARLLVCQDEAPEAGVIQQVGYLANVALRESAFIRGRMITRVLIPTLPTAPADISDRPLEPPWQRSFPGSKTSLLEVVAPVTCRARIS